MGKVVLWFGLLIITIAIFVPFSPKMPASSLDPSWMFGMNQATAQGFSFGKDIIFTFGPYASIYTRTYHPSTDFMMVSGSLYLAILYWACFVLLMKNVQYRWVLAFCAVLGGLMYLQDALFFSFPLLVGLITFKILLLEEEKLVKSKWAPFYVALLFTSFGLLPLVKGSILILCASVTALCSAFFIANRHRLLAIICLFTPIVSMLFFWVASGQSVTTLPTYFISMAPLISGYTEAMAVDGNIYEVVLYLVASAFLLLTIFIQTKITNSSKIFLFCIYFVFLFLSFKSGFVRHDGHAIISGTSILIAALLLPFIFNTRIILPAIFFALISWGYIDNHYIKTSTERIVNNFKSTYLSAWNGIKNRMRNRNWPRINYDAAVTALREQASFRSLQGTTDIYSYNQSYLIASRNTWSPRPIFQSYSVYTPTLAEINRKHLLGEHAPNNIIFRMEPIDRRLPSIEDGASWPILMINYQPISMENDFLFLQKKESISGIGEPLKLTSEKHNFGESVNLPHSSQPIFVQIDIKPTIIGRLASVFFKPSQLQITIELKNGIKKQYRIIAGMAKSGFLISPLIENTAEFGMLYGKNEFLGGKLVKSITIIPRDGKTSLWNDEYTVTFNQFRSPTPIDLSKIYKFDGFDDKLSDSKITMAKKCDGSIDAINNMSPAPKQFSASNLLRVNGWLAASVDKKALPEAVYVVFTDNQNNSKYLRTRVTLRPDVGTAFKKPELDKSGYDTMADISALEGKYTLGLAIKMSDNVQICPQFKIPVFITK
jgi:hypothetical protein